MIRALRIWSDQRRLAKILRKRRQSFEHRQFLNHRAAALRGRMNRVVPEAQRM